MNFSEKLQILRKSKGFTQEGLAAELDVSRQAVAKWETGMSFPDVANLIQISNLLHVTVDYLIKEQACGIQPVPGSDENLEALIAFRLQAGRNTYAACLNEVEATRLDSRDFRYADGPYVYHDSYVGGEQFAGQEAIWKNGRAVYAMNYMGRVLNEKFSGHFLKEALRSATRDLPYRGPETYQAGEYIYRCKVSGDIDWFQGFEEIWCSNEKVYECCFHGGLMR